MGEGEVGALLRETMIVVLKLGGPLLFIGLVVGVVVALFQAVTQINDSAVAFVPKVLAISVALVLLGPFMLATLTGYTTMLFSQMVTVGGL